MRMKRSLWAAAAAAFLLVAGGMSPAFSMESMKDGTATVKLSPLGGAKSAAAGEATFALRGGALHYKLYVDKAVDATMAHVHMVGGEGMPGAVVVWLFPSTHPGPGLKKGTFTGTLAEGDITAGDLTGPMKGATVDDLYEKIEYGKAGVVVHTQQNPSGALWGFRKGHGAMEKKPDKM